MSNLAYKPQPVASEDSIFEKAIANAIAHISRVPVSKTLIDSISKEDWNSKDMLDAEISTGGKMASPDERDDS